ncbi:5-oxoprolinase subunit PxpA [Polaribacter septentrionalilitoris]|uniref:5-oxoprolinase subunit PxpA n=1 Tax=Polaribacter septentrionalilitoris TaxID=2494657 RepID=UPI00135AF657|nr:5-oxoprolinase subunit PxpA [Polaribacter septentrionalilitoris]
MKIDINCDVGEGIANEHLLMPYISSCNIACGGHFGDQKTIDNTIQLAIENNVKIGAHPSFPDKINFGRKVMNISNAKLQKSIQNQMDLFLERLCKTDAKLHHIKPHGALYNLIAIDEITAEKFLESTKPYLKDVFLYVPYGSKIEEVALKKNISIKYEAFADRNYTDNLKLVSRNEKNAVIKNPKEVYNHIHKMISDGKVNTISGLAKEIKADTFCVHGDHKNSLQILEFLWQEFSKNGIEIG